MAGKVIDATLRFVDKFTKPMRDAVGKIEKSSRQINRLGKDIEKAGKKISAVGSTLTKGITIPIVAAGAASIKAGIDFESAFAGVKKTVTATDEQLTTLKQGIIDMSKGIPASATEISAIGEAAGQLGIETDNILGFTRVMIDLGNSTNLSSEEAASALAKYANVTGMSQKDFDRLGSVVVALGNNFATTEADIVSMATRLSGAGNQIGLSDGEIMGFSAALSSVGIEAEMGGSAFSKAMINMQLACETGMEPVENLSKKTGMSLRELQLMSANNSKDFKEMAQSLGYTANEMNATIKAGVNLENFADVAGMTSKEFKKAYEQDAAGALESFIKGLGNTENKGESTIKMLQDMGFTEVRLRDTLTRLSQSGDNMAKAVKMGNEEWIDNNALTNEANQRYETTASKVQIMKNKLTALGIQIGDILLPPFNSMIDSVEKATEWFSNLSPKTQNTIVKIAVLAATVGPCVVGVGKLVSTTGKAIQMFSKLPVGINKVKSAVSKLSPANIKATAAIVKQNAVLAIQKTRMIATKVGMLALKGVQLISTGVTTAMTAAQWALNAAFFASPIGWIVLGIGAVIAIGILLYKNWDKVKEKAGELWGHVKRIFGGIGEWFGGIWDGVKTGFKGFINFVIGGLNKIPEGLNKLKVKIPDFIPGVGGKSLAFNVPTIPYLAKGTKNWKGGLAVTQEAGGEIMDLPRGTRVYPHDKSLQMAYQNGIKSSSGSNVININKLADKIEVRSNEDIDMIVEKLAEKLTKIIGNGGAVLV